jgi:TPP-dependent pyruvate/acetoin dehydrogenase alpha subunit
MKLLGNWETQVPLRDCFETINAAGVLQVPLVISVWDDDYGISVHAKQINKENISEILKGFQRNDTAEGYEILRVGWDYSELIATYEKQLLFTCITFGNDTC